MRLALIRYVVMLLIPSVCSRTPVRGAGPRMGVRVDTRLNPQVDLGL